MQLDESFHGRSVHAKRGETIDVQLPENPTTGYRWHVTVGGAPVCVPIADSFAASAVPPGRGGLHTWSFKAVLAGTCDISLTYRRNWSQPEPQARIFTVHIVVEEQGRE